MIMFPKVSSSNWPQQASLMTAQFAWKISYLEHAYPGARNTPRTLTDHDLNSDSNFCVIALGSNFKINSRHHEFSLPRQQQQLTSILTRRWATALIAISVSPQKRPSDRPKWSIGVAAGAGAFGPGHDPRITEPSSQWSFQLARRRGSSRRQPYRDCHSCLEWSEKKTPRGK